MGWWWGGGRAGRITARPCLLHLIGLVRGCQWPVLRGWGGAVGTSAIAMLPGVEPGASRAAAIRGAAAAAVEAVETIEIDAFVHAAAMRWPRGGVGGDDEWCSACARGSWFERSRVRSRERFDGGSI